MRTGAVLALCLALIALPGIACAQTSPPLPEPGRSKSTATEKQILEKLDKMIKQVEVKTTAVEPRVVPAQQVYPNPVIPPPTGLPEISQAIPPSSVPNVVSPGPPPLSPPVAPKFDGPPNTPPPLPPQVKPETPASVRIRDVLNKTIALDYTAKDFPEVVKHFREKTGVQFVLDPSLANNPTVAGRTPVILKASGVSLRVALNGVLTQHHLGYAVVGETVFITTEQEAASQRLRQLVQIDVSGAPLKTVLQQLSADTGVNVVLDPRLRATKAEDERITLNVQEVAVHNAARLLAEFANLKAVQVGTVLVITTPEYAARLSQDNPPAVVPATAFSHNNFQP